MKKARKLFELTEACYKGDDIDPKKDDDFENYCDEWNKLIKFVLNKG